MEQAIADAAKRFEKEHVQNSSMENELDWQGLEKFVCQNLFTQISTSFLLPDKKDRDDLRSHIYHSAYAQAKATTMPKQSEVNNTDTNFKLKSPDFNRPAKPGLRYST